MKKMRNISKSQLLNTKLLVHMFKFFKSNFKVLNDYKSLLVITVIFHLAILLSAADSPEYPCYHVAMPPVLNGEDDDAGWSALPTAGGFFIHGGKDYAIEKRTFFRAAWTDDNLYIHVKCYEPLADRMKAVSADGDLPWNEDSVEILFPGVPEFQFIANSVGARWAGTGGRGVSQRKWDVRSGKLEKGWFLEIRIPFVVLGRTPKAGEKWPVNIARNTTTGSAAERANCWASLQKGFNDLDRFGRFVFSGDVPGGNQVKTDEERLNTPFHQYLREQCATGIKAAGEGVLKAALDNPALAVTNKPMKEVLAQLTALQSCADADPDDMLVLLMKWRNLTDVFLKKDALPASIPGRNASTKAVRPAGLSSFLALSKPNPAIPFGPFVNSNRPCAVYGRYTPDGRIVFDGQCVHPWEFMATGTGVSGLTIAAGREISGQLNHSAAFGERCNLLSLGRFRLDWGGNTVERMEHDLRRSVITIESKEGDVRLEIRAHKELDVIRIDIVDLRQMKQELQLQLLKDYAFEERAEGDTWLSWHVNSSSVYRALNEKCGVPPTDPSPDFLLGRCFGTAIAMDVPDGKAQWRSGNISGRGRHVTLWIAAGSNISGFDAWRSDVLSRLTRARAMGDDFIVSHETWWRDFWGRSRLELPGDDGTNLRLQAAFDLYRYYLTCSADRRRETPVRWINELFRPGLPCNPFDITSIETYQMLYGAMRTGDLSALASRLEFYVHALPLMKIHGCHRFGHAGTVAPYEHNIWGTFMPGVNWTEAGSPWMRYSWQGNLWMLMLFCDYAALSKDTKLIDEGLFTYASEVLAFFHAHYPNRRNGRIDFTPSAAGETFSGVTDSAELITAMKGLLPRLLALGESRSWDKTTLALWSRMRRDLPDLPRGSICYENGAEKPILKSSDLLAPAARLDKIDPPRPINRQHPELYSIWPGKLVLRDDRERDAAHRSYIARFNQHITTGWALDPVFAACLGLRADVERWWPFHFDATFTYPCGLAQEDESHQSPSMQGLGTGVIPVLEMLLQDYPDMLVILPCWDPKVAVRYSLLSPYAGKVTVDYDPAHGATVQTERPIRVKCGDGIVLAPLYGR